MNVVPGYHLLIRLPAATGPPGSSSSASRSVVLASLLRATLSAWTAAIWIDRLLMKHTGHTHTTQKNSKLVLLVCFLVPAPSVTVGGVIRQPHCCCPIAQHNQQLRPSVPHYSYFVLDDGRLLHHRPVVLVSPVRRCSVGVGGYAHLGAALHTPPPPARQTGLFAS